MHGSEPSIVIVTPAEAASNNGNWRTAERWARLLGAAYRVRIVQHWEASDGTADDLMIALHAVRSARSLSAWRRSGPKRPLVLVLTGTDLYGNLSSDAEAQRSTDGADAIVVLNEIAPLSLPEHQRARCHVVLQSCERIEPLPAPRPPLVALMVGHLRAVKDPATFFRAILRSRQMRDAGALAFRHIGQALDDDLGQQARRLAAEDRRYAWLGMQSHEQTREHIRRAHLLVHSSVAEGGAQAVIEAIRCGVPVLASEIDGNVGLLGSSYAGYFAPGDDAALADLLARTMDDPALLPTLRQQVESRAPLFSPEREQAALNRIVAPLLTG